MTSALGQLLSKSNQGLVAYNQIFPLQPMSNSKSRMWFSLSPIMKKVLSARLRVRVLDGVICGTAPCENQGDRRIFIYQTQEILWKAAPP